MLTKLKKKKKKKLDQFIEILFFLRMQVTSYLFAESNVSSEQIFRTLTRHYMVICYTLNSRFGTGETFVSSHHEPARNWIFLASYNIHAFTRCMESDTTERRTAMRQRERERDDEEGGKDGRRERRGSGSGYRSQATVQQKAIRRVKLNLAGGRCI